MLAQGMQVVVLALIRSIPPIASVALFGLFEFIVFAIIGVQLFSGKLGACNQVVGTPSGLQTRDPNVQVLCVGAHLADVSLYCTALHQSWARMQCPAVLCCVLLCSAAMQCLM